MLAAREGQPCCKELQRVLLVLLAIPASAAITDKNKLFSMLCAVEHSTGFNLRARQVSVQRIAIMSLLRRC